MSPGIGYQIILYKDIVAIRSNNIGLPTNGINNRIVDLIIIDLQNSQLTFLRIYWLNYEKYIYSFIETHIIGISIVIFNRYNNDNWSICVTCNYW